MTEDRATIQSIDRLAPWLRLDRFLSGNGLPEHCPPADPQAWSDLADDIASAGLAGLVRSAGVPRGLAAPDSFNAALQRAAAHNAGATLRMLNQLPGVLAILNAASIPAMLLKGAALHHTVLDRIDVRPMSDVDLLVPFRAAGHACHVLAHAGFRTEDSPVNAALFPEFYYEIAWWSPDSTPLRVDLHARPFRPLRLAWTIPVDAFWRNASPIRVGDQEVFVPSPEHMLIHLAGHAAYHGRGRLLWLNDIRSTVETYGRSLRWDVVVETCRAWRLGLPSAKALRRVNDLFGSVIPERVLVSLEGVHSNWQDRLTLAVAPREAQWGWVALLVNWLTIPGWRSRLTYLRAVSHAARASMSRLGQSGLGPRVILAYGRRAALTLCRLIRPSRRDITGNTPTPHTVA